MDEQRTALGNVWNEDEDMLLKMAIIFQSFGADAIGMNHYELTEASFGALPDEQNTAGNWRQFLSDKRVVKYITQEFEFIKQTEIKKAVKDISQSKSVGQAQIINALDKLIEEEEDEDEKLLNTGPIFVYCYIPPNSEQIHADNVEVMTEDPFERTT